MPLLKFKPEFVQSVRMGLLELAAESKQIPNEILGLNEGLPRKRFTIRKYRKDGHDPKAGDTLYLYETDGHVCGPKIGQPTCLFTIPLEIHAEGLVVGEAPGIVSTQFYNRLGEGEIKDALAKMDGFAGWPEMQAWFKETHGKLPFKGLGIAW